MNILTKQTLDKGNTPKDILMIRRLIENEEFLNTYTLDILSESKQFANLSDRAKINIEDVKLAVKLRQQNMYSKKPDIASLNQMAKETNSFVLPHIPENPHILLPPPEHSLIRNNFQVYSEDLANMLNNPNFDQEEKNKLEDLELHSAYNNKGKSRKSIIGIKRHTERNTERLSISSNFKKRKTDLDENADYKSKNFNSEFANKDYNIINNNSNVNNINISSKNYLNSNVNNNINNNKQKNLNSNFNNKANGENKGVAQKNRRRLESDNNIIEDEENKSENQDFGDNDYNNDEGDADDYDQMENHSENSEGNFGLRDDFNHSDMGDYL